MNLEYLVAGGSGLVVLVLGLVYFIFSRSKKSKADPQSTGQQQEPKKTHKDDSLSSDFILSAIEDGVVMVGQDKVIHLFNPAASKITGWPPDEAVGLNFVNVINVVNEKGQPCPEQDHPFTKALSTNTTVRDTRGWLATKAGKKIPISLIVSPVIEKNGTPATSVVGVFRDATADREEEARRSEFISTASHEMRTPLAAIDGYLALSLNPKITKIDDNAKKYLEKAATATKHLSDLFRDLLTSSRAEDGRLSSYPVVVELGEIIEQVVDAERFQAKEKGLELVYAVSKPTEVQGAKVVRPFYYTFVDPNRIREVLQNLINNAIKYTPEGSVTVRLTGDNSITQIQVQDTGPGIPAEDLPHLFQKFYRVDNSMTRTIGGTGLGLYISRRIIEMYNGRIWVESEIGKGSTFFINLPRLTSTQALEMQKKQAATVSPLDTH